MSSFGLVVGDIGLNLVDPAEFGHPDSINLGWVRPNFDRFGPEFARNRLTHSDFSRIWPDFGERCGAESSWRFRAKFDGIGEIWAMRQPGVARCRPSVPQIRPKLGRSRPATRTSTQTAARDLSPASGFGPPHPTPDLRSSGVWGCSAHSLQLCMSRRILHAPRSRRGPPGGGAPNSANTLGKKQAFPNGKLAGAASWWRWVGHAAQMDPDEHAWLATIAVARCHVGRNGGFPPVDPPGLNKTPPRTRPQTRRQTPLGCPSLRQLTVDAGWRDDWQSLAQDTVRWRELAAAFVATVMRAKGPWTPPAGRHQSRPTQDMG